MLKPTDDEITEYLDSLFLTLCDAVSDVAGSDALTPATVYDLLLGRVFDFAVEKEWIEPPFSGDDIFSRPPEEWASVPPPEESERLGSWLVPIGYKAEFIGRIGDSVSYLPIEEWEEARQRDDQRETKFTEPTPKDLIEGLIKTRRFWTRKWLAWEMVGVPDQDGHAPDPIADRQKRRAFLAAKQFIDRQCRIPSVIRNQRYNSRGEAQAMDLLKVMQRRKPNEYGHLKHTALFWTVE